MKKNKPKALELLKQKTNGEIKITYQEISNQTKYSRMQLTRLIKELEERDIDSILIHGNTGIAHNVAPLPEVDYIKEFKKQYPLITISQFMDIYHEDVIWGKEHIDDVLNYNLKVRSYSFFQSLYHEFKWIIPRPHKPFNKNSIVHSLRDPSPRRGILIIIDGTPHDWFRNGKKQSLHLAIDDATGEYIAGWFMENENLEGYCHLLYLILSKFGIPISFYSDKYSVFRNPNDNDSPTTFALICEELGVQMIFANSPEAKGKIEKANDTIQQRLLNDIKRFKITSIEQLNEWFNYFYCKYLNKKFSYLPKEDKNEFVPLTKEYKKIKLYDLFSVKDTRTILNGNSISINNNYYVPIDKDNNHVPFYKGSLVDVWENIFDHEIKIFKNNILYKTKQIEGHRQSEELQQLKVNNKKELNAALDAVYSSSEERRKTIQAIIDKNAEAENEIKKIMERNKILRNAGKNKDISKLLK